MVGGRFDMEKYIYIVGAHSRGQTFCEYVSFLYPDTKIEAFLVDDPEENDSTFRDIPIMKLCGKSITHKDYPIYLATRGVYHEKLTNELQQMGVQHIVPVSIDLDIKLRNAYVEKKFKENHRELICVGSSSRPSQLDARIYVATSIYDKELREQYEMDDKECVIQVGAALTDQRFSEKGITDYTGENISERNKQFCELTALYWIWKNAKEDLLGLVHYRRHFILPSHWMEWMDEQEVDVILPIPLYVAPNLEGNYKSRHTAGDWEFMMKYLSEYYPYDYEHAKMFFKTGLYSPCNMFIMRRDVLNDLCSWLFPILDAVVEHSGQREDVYQNRYPGFLAERLITFFFDRHREQYKVAYANKIFLK